VAAPSKGLSSAGRIVGAASMRNHLDMRVLRRAWTSEPSDREPALPRDLNVNPIFASIARRRYLGQPWPTLAIAVDRIHWHLLAALAGAADPSRRGTAETAQAARAVTAVRSAHRAA
jgi:hypothetical protein